MNFSLLSLKFLSRHLSRRFRKFLSWSCDAASRVSPFRGRCGGLMVGALDSRASDPVRALAGDIVLGS